MLGRIIKEQQTPCKSVATATKLRDALKIGLVQKASPVPPKAGDWFRSSGLPKLCPRMYALAAQRAFSINTDVDAELGWVFGIGTAMHRQFQEEFLRKIPTGVFQGWWRNRATGYVSKGDSLAINHNAECLSHSWAAQPSGDSDDYEYVELSFRNAEYRITGHCDGVLVWPDSEPEIFELKTISEMGYYAVDPDGGGKPKAEHVLQAQAYLWMSGLKRARIVYFCKKFGKINDMICEHVVERDEQIIDSIKKHLKDSIDALDNGTMPVRMAECRTKSSDRAKYCPAKAACFS